MRISVITPVPFDLEKNKLGREEGGRRRRRKGHISRDQPRLYPNGASSKLFLN